MNNIVKKMNAPINQWCLGEPNKLYRDDLSKCVFVNGKSLWCSEELSVLFEKTPNRETLVLGQCFDVTGKWNADDIAIKLNELEFDQFVIAIENLCGIYTIFRCDEEGFKIFGDATHMMPIYYGVADYNKGYVATCESYISQLDEPSVSAKKILDCERRGQHELAGDITMFEDVRCLIANHYFDLTNNKNIRYFPREQLNSINNFKDARIVIDETIEMVLNVICQCARKGMSFASPLTEGSDSRVNCSLLRKAIGDSDILYYVVMMPFMEKINGDSEFITMVASRLGCKGFKILPFVPSLRDEDVAKLKKKYNDIRTWGKYIWAYHPSVGDRTIINGQLIDQIGRASKGLQRPEIFSKYFIYLKSANVSKEAFNHLSHWHAKTKPKSKGYSMYDLWGWEFRCGRWNSNIISHNSLIGIRDFNVYNSTAILSRWCRISRKLRESRIVHRRFLDILAPEVRDIPFNPFYVPSTHLPLFLNKWVNKLLPAGLVQEVGNYVLYKMKQVCRVR